MQVKEQPGLHRITIGCVLAVRGVAAFTIHRPVPLNQGQAPEFSPLLYTLDLLLPIAGFGQKGAFNPRGWQH